jgi:hypothetical protein
MRIFLFFLSCIFDFNHASSDNFDFTQHPSLFFKLYSTLSEGKSISPSERCHAVNYYFSFPLETFQAIEGFKSKEFRHFIANLLIQMEATGKIR